MNSSLLWHSVIPWPVLLPAVALLMGGIFWSLRKGIHSPRRILIFGILRVLILLLILVMILQPQQQREEVTILKPQIAILMDGSKSMNDPVDPSQPLRSKRVVDWFHSPSVARAKKDFDLRIFRFGKSLEEQGGDITDWKFNGDKSCVIEAVNHVQEHFRGQPLAGVLLLSDGIDNSRGDLGAVTETNVPVMTFELEKPFVPKKQEKKLTLAGVDYPPRITMGRDTDIRVSLSGEGMSGQAVPVELWRNGSLLNTIPVSFNEDDQTRVATFSVSEHQSGSVQFEIKVNHPAADQETHDYPFLIQVMEPGNRVIYLQNSLGFDFKFLRKAIVTDRNLQLSTFVRLPGGRIAMIDGSGSQAGGELDFSQKSLGNC